MAAFQCWTCGKTFTAGYDARENHCQDTGHEAPAFECETCGKLFSNQDSCDQHMTALGHFCDTYDDAYECHFCDSEFTNEEDLSDHELEKQAYCPMCDVLFVNKHALTQHLSSGSAHVVPSRPRTEPSMPCFYCDFTFATASGMISHIETGCCPGAEGFNRDDMYNLIRERDTTGWVTRRLPGASYQSKKYTATQRAWNGSAYKCYLCGREFSELRDLHQHLNSVAHQEYIYHCPHDTCKQRFVTLAGCLNHIESEKCGYEAFETVQEVYQDLVTNSRATWNLD